jgi:signal peptidase I
MPISPKKKAKENASLWSRLDPFTYVDRFLMPTLNPWNNEILSWVIYIVFSFIFAYALYSIFGFILQTASPLVIVVSGSMLPTMARGDVVILQGINGENVNAPEMVLDGIDVQNSSLRELADYEMQSQGIWKITFKANGQTILVPKQGNTDIIVYVSNYKGLEIIHRAVVKIRSDGDYFLLTKGDNNPSLDQDCGEVSELLFPDAPSIQTTTGKSCPSPYPVPLSDVKGKALFWVPWLGYVKLVLVDGLQTFFG